MLISKHMWATLVSCRPYLVVDHSFSTHAKNKFGANVSQNYVLDGKMCKFVGSVVEWLKHTACDQHSPVQILLAPFCYVLGKTLYSTFPAWWSWQAVLNFFYI